MDSAFSSKDLDLHCYYPPGTSMNVKTPTAFVQMLPLHASLLFISEFKMCSIIATYKIACIFFFSFNC